MKKIIFIITIFLTIISSAHAATATLVKHRIEDYYVYYYDKSQERERYIYANRYVFGTTTAYCLELGKDISSNIYTYSTAFEELPYDKDTLDYIKIVAYYGYDYPGHNTVEYYMAAQELIWEKISDVDVTWVDGVLTTNYVNIESEKNTIKNQIEEHYKLPSFDRIQIDYTLGESLTIEDTNNVLNKFETTVENVIIDGNKLIITEDFDEEEIILTHPNYTGNKFLFYTSGTSQKMMSTGVINDEVKSIIKINVISGSLEINKLDKDTQDNKPQGEATLDGAVYELYNEDNVTVGTITTGYNNKLEKIPIGKYTLKEKIPSKGYLLDEKTYNIEITKDTPNIKLDVYEKVINRKVDIFKVFASNKTGELIPEVGISFEVYDNNNNLLDTLTTDSDGYTSITLPYGIYIFKQITTTENYYKVENFNITISEYDEKPIYKLLSDSEITAKVKIIKKDFTTFENVLNSSIKFKIYDLKNKKYVTMKVSYPETKVTDTFQVDKKGIFITPEPLSAGTYHIYEVNEDMNGYLFNSTPVQFTIGTKSNFIEEDGETVIQVPFYNQKVKGSINITKYGEKIEYTDNTYYYKEINLEGVVLKLYAKEDICENSKLIYTKDQIIKEITTDENGIAHINNLPLGEYYLKEISTIENHVLEETIYDINLAYKDQKTLNVTEDIKIKNYLQKGKLIINKYETGSNIPISNTLIEICNKDNTVVYKGYTDEDGQIQIDDLAYGEYYISEVEAATGYRLLEDKIDFEIKEEETKINIYNERIKVPNTGFTLTPVDIFVILVILLGFALIIFFPKEKTTVFLSIIIILLGITYFVIIIYKYYNDYQNNQKSITAYVNNDIETVTEEKYKYNSILEIPSVNIKRGILDINNEYNQAKYNIELVKEDDNTIVLAAHNGNYRNSYFGTLHNIELGDEINYYKDGNLYTYIYTDYYDIKKNGYADIYRKDDLPSIILITCKDNTDDAQTIYIGYLKEINTY